MNQILLLLDSKENQRLLAEILLPRYEVILPDSDDALENYFDLCILDGRALDRLWKKVQERKQAGAHTFLPFLLVTSRRDVGKATRYLWKVIDELIISPIEKIELQARVDGLLLTRRLSMEFSRSVVENSPMGIVVLGRDGKVHLWSPACERIFGWKEDEVLGQAYPAPPTECENQFRALLEAVFRGDMVLNFEAQRQRKDGTLIDISFSAAPLRDADGFVTHAMSIFTDITERKRAEETLQASEQRYRQLFDGSTDAIFVLAADGRFLDANRMAEQRYGYSRQEFLGMTARELAAPDLQSEAAAKINQALESGASFEWQHQTKEGRQIWVEISTQAITLDDQPCVLSTVRDITERKQAEQAINMRAKELTALNALGQQVGQTLSLDEVIAAGLQGMLRAVQPDLAFLFLREGERLIQKLIVPEQAKVRLGEVPEHRVGECMCGLAVREKRALYSQDIFQDMRCTWEECKEAGTRSFAALPLLSGGEVIGVIGLASDQARDFETQSEYLETLSNTVATSLNNARLYQQVRKSVASLEQRTRQQQALFKISAAFFHSDEKSDYFASVLDTMRENMAYTHMAIMSIDSQTGDRVLERQYGWDEQPEGFRLRPGEGLSEKAVLTGEMQYRPDVSALPGYFGAASGCRSEVDVPIKVADTVVGVLITEDRGEDAFGEDDFTLLQSVANIIGVVLEKSSLYDNLEQRIAERTAELERLNRRDEALAEINVTISQPFELQSVLEKIATLTGQFLPASYASVVLWDDSTKSFSISASTVPGQHAGMGAQRVRQSSGASRWIVDSQQALVVPDTQDDPFEANRMLGEHALQAYVGVPLVFEGRSLGVLYALEKEPRQFSERDLEFMQDLASRAAIAVHKVRVYEELQLAKDQAQSADRLKSAFLATMSHELRTPLNSIIGFSGVIMQELAGPLNSEQRKQMGMVQNSARHLLALINDVLDISKIEAGQFDIHPAVFDLRQAINEVIKTLRPAAEKKGLVLESHIAPEVGHINSDQRRVEQVLINLVNNAVKFTEKGSVTIKVSTILDLGFTNDASQIPNRKSKIEIQVVDTGIGIAPENISALFEPFRQIDSGLTRAHEGTGLGLSICKRLVEMLGGEIWVESEGEGKGSVFGFTIDDLRFTNAD